ncbi:MAG TPA: N-acetylmuramoyl-L-alanine amidase [Kofleriaceae bacterium]|nr:N-acetylmuramoyl-L-alanine amidase [Kofleriaceae bacterium]
MIAVAALARGAGASPSAGDGPEPPGARARPVASKGGIADGRAPVARLRSDLQGRASEGTLSGKIVYLSAGHGWTYVGGGWHTQRGNTNGLVEDFITTEGVAQYLVPYLRNMGAYVVPIRESDLNPSSVAVDDGEAVLEGVEASADGTGWAPFSPPIDASLQPFERGTASVMTAAASESGRAVFPFSVPESGHYNVYIAYVQGSDRVPDAHVVVRHGGGESHLRVDQRRHGATWVLVGRFWFAADAPVEESSVAFANDSESPGKVISFDAVRVGGGMAVHDLGGGTNQRPMFEQSSRYSAQLNGAPPDVYRYFDGGEGDDVVARPRFTDWDHEQGEDAVYLAWHTNAPNPGRGTSSHTYGTQYPCCGPLSDFVGVPGSLELQAAVHGEVVGDLRAGWDAGWQDRGQSTADFGELRPLHNDEVPGVLLELAFHDTPADADALRDPRFRRIAARAMAQGIARYFAARDGRDLVLPPEPPRAVRVENDGAGGLTVSWRPPDPDPAGGGAPDGYRVYVSRNGYAFDDGTAVSDESAALDGLEPGEVRYVRVAAVNAGGESLPSEVVGARVATGGRAPVLVVAGFDRLDGDLLPRTELSAFGLGTVDRMFLAQINDGSYAARHGAAIAAAGYSFDGASDEAVEDGDIDLAAYTAVDWFTGEDSTGNDPFPAGSREALDHFLLGGGRLLLSGSEVVWALADQGDADDMAFAQGVLRVGLAADDAETYQVMALDGPLAALAPFAFDDTGPGGYDADFPDVLAPGGEGAVPVLAYQGGAVAAIAWGVGAGEGSPMAVVLGFPFEVIAGPDARAALMGAALEMFGVAEEPARPDEDDPDEEDEDESGYVGGCGCRSGDGSGWTALLLAALGFMLRGWRSSSTRAPARSRPGRSG